jgi:hypothetical protein
MSPQLRKLALTVHVVSSVGWLGAVAVFLLLTIVGLTSRDPLEVRAAYLTMDRIGWLAIVPACFASLVTGIVQALGTPWGLLRHYWVLIKLAITVLASAILMVHTRPIDHLAHVAIQMPLSDTERAAQIQIAADAAMALLALLTATTLSMYKPRGVTGYGRRRNLSAHAD